MHKDTAPNDLKYIDKSLILYNMYKSPSWHRRHNKTQCGDRGCLRGMCPSEAEKIVIFKVSLHDLVHSFCLGCPHKVRHPISAKNRGGVRWVPPPLNPPLILGPCYFSLEQGSLKSKFVFSHSSVDSFQLSALETNATKVGLQILEHNVDYLGLESGNKIF